MPNTVVVKIIPLKEWLLTLPAAERQEIAEATASGTVGAYSAYGASLTRDGQHVMVK